VGELAAEAGGTKALIVTDPGILGAGYPAKAQAYLEAAGLKVGIFSAVHENPTTEDVARCVSAAREMGADILIGLGGGSSMDTAKGCNFIYTNGGEMKDYWGTHAATKPMLPLIAIPTTAGTGSECQSYALISDPVTHAKMACGDPKAAARVAILDAELTLSQPQRVTVCTGIDAVSHAVESAVTKRKSALSEVFSREAFRLCNEGFESVLKNPSSLAARSQMLLGAAYAGTAIENSMLGAAHSCANPLTAKFGVVHGEAVGVMLPHVVRFNSAVETAAETYRSLYVGDLAARLTKLLKLAAMPVNLTSYGVTEADLPELAKMAKTQWTAQFNPREVSEADFVELYRAALRE
jgi:alcohol dehydrogenase